MKDNILDLNGSQSLVVEMDYEGVKSGDHESNNQETNTQSPQDYDNESEVVVSQDEQESDTPEVKKPRSKRWEKERRDREQKYLLTEALAEERRRNLELQKYLHQSLDNNTMSRADKAMYKLEEAEKAHALALESNDSLAAAKASTALIQANLALERVANTQQYSNEEQERPQISPKVLAADKLLNDWLVDNPEFDEDSDSFNKELVTRVAPLIDRLDGKLKKRGQGDLISSPMYFDIIDTVVSQIKSGKKYDRPATAPVSSRNHSRQYNQDHKTTLTDQQRIVAAGCNMTEQQYMNWLKKYEKDKFEQENNRSSYGY